MNDQTVASDQTAGQLERSARPDRFDRVPWGAVVTFIVLAYGLAWACMLPIWRIDLDDPSNQTLGVQLMAQGLTIAMMWTPAVAALIVVFLMKRPGQHRARLLGLWPLRPAKRVVWWIVGGFLAPFVLVAVSLAVAIAFGWFTPDFENFSQFAASLGGLDIGMSVQALVAVQLLSLPFAALVNIVPAFGEELGWRGWLVPALRPLGTWPALLLSGVIWGVWHSPVTLLGHNFGFYDWRGVALMTVGCVFWGILLGWSRLRSGSVWPAVIGHGALNAAGGVFLVVGMAGEELHLALVNPLGVSGWIVLAAAIAVVLLTRQLTPEPELASARRAPRPEPLA